MEFFNDRDVIIQLTPLWKGERFDDGRPRVPDDILKRMERVTTEEAWSVLWRDGYEYQFVSGWTRLPATKRLVGRAVTGAFIPMRPDLHNTLMDLGNNKEGRIGEMNSWVIETLVEDDVIVIDLFDKVWKGTYSGANLSTAIASRTGLSTTGVEKILTRLKKKGVLKRVGPAKGGYWEVVE